LRVKAEWEFLGIVQELLTKKPEDLSMDDHRLKGFYLANKKTMCGYDAWELAREQLKKIKKRSSFIYPQFGKESMAKIQGYKPENGLPDSVHRPF
jgi:hypothetical protein